MAFGGHLFDFRKGLDVILHELGNYAMHLGMQLEVSSISSLGVLPGWAKCDKIGSSKPRLLDTYT